MKLRINVPEAWTLTVDEVAKKIAAAQGWTVEPWPSNESSMANVVLMKTPAGRVGQYDVVNDILVWNDDPNETEYVFFGDDEMDEFHLDDTLEEFLDIPFVVWGEDEDDNWVLFGNSNIKAEN